MELKDILAQPAAWLETLRAKQAAATTAADGVADLVDAQAKAIEARIASLTEQKATMMQQFDTAIATHTDTLAALQAGSAGAAAARVLDPAPPAPKRGAATRKPSAKG